MKTATANRWKNCLAVVSVVSLPVLAWFQFDFSGSRSEVDRGAMTMAVASSLGLASPEPPQQLSEETLRIAAKCLADAEELDRPRRDGEARQEMLAAYTPLAD